RHGRTVRSVFAGESAERGAWTEGHPSGAVHSGGPQGHGLAVFSPGSARRSRRRSRHRGAGAARCRKGSAEPRRGMRHPDLSERRTAPSEGLCPAPSGRNSHALYSEKTGCSWQTGPRPNPFVARAPPRPALSPSEWGCIAMSDDEQDVGRRSPVRQERADRPAGNPLASIDYSRPQDPHDIHPALGPGIASDEQRRRYSVDKSGVGVAGADTVGFGVWGVIDPAGVGGVAGALAVGCVIGGVIGPAGVGEVADAAYGWTLTHLGWLFNAVATVVLVSLLILAFSRYGKIPLGKDGEKPEFSTFSWVAMLF